MAGQEKAYEKLPGRFVDLLINAGIMNSVSGAWPEEVQERWTEKLKSMGEWVAQQTAEVQEFASFFD